MFTGLIQALGTLQRVSEDGLTIHCHPTTADLILQDLAIGDSVAVDGVCLTVTEILSQGFTADASPETLRRSTLGETQLPVNLETSLRVGSKLGGHFVTGHVDGIGYLEQSIQTATSWEMTFAVKEPAIARYILPKGSIAVNGVSLTVATCAPSGSWFTVAVIPLTYAETNLSQLKPGSWVNLEGDILGKYVEKFLRTGGQIQTNSSKGNEDGEDYLTSFSDLEPITPAFLAEHGY